MYVVTEMGIRVAVIGRGDNCGDGGSKESLDALLMVMMVWWCGGVMVVT